jgi:O-antigen/teichoic acid export membrane protein
LKLIRKAIPNIIGAIAPIMLAIATVPHYLVIIGQEKYGILAMLWLVVGYFSLFDLGLGRATAQKVASSNDVTESLDILWSSIVLNFIIGGFLSLALGCILFIFHSMNNEIVVLGENFDLETGIWIILSIPAMTVSAVLNGALIGMNRFWVLNFFSVLNTSLTMILPLISSVIYGPNINLIIVSTIIGRIISFYALFIYIFGRVISKGNSVKYSRNRSIEMLKYGAWVTISSVVSPLLVMMDRIMIGGVSGAGMVGVYTIPYQMTEKTTIIAKSISNSLFPIFSSKNTVDPVSLLSESISKLVSITFPIFFILIYIIEILLKYWIGADISNMVSFPSRILLVAFYINGIAAVAYSMIQASGRPDIVARLHLFEILPYTLILYILVVQYGIVGASIALLLRLTFDCGMLLKYAKIKLIYLIDIIATIYVYSVIIYLLEYVDIAIKLEYTLHSLLVLVSAFWFLNRYKILYGNYMKIKA